MKINLSNAKKIKTLKGFGGSSCWWSTGVKNEKDAEDVAKLLYGDDGLKMNIYRYNVGGGFEEGNVRVDNPWRVVESFMDEDGTYHWDRDKNAVRMMKKSLDTGNVDTLIFFANSPHFSHTVTRQASGGFQEHFSNLPRENYDAFAKYLIDIAEHFIDEGYPVKYISPINEPQWKWGGDYVWQEGCHYEPEEVRDCFLAFAKELERRNSSLLLYGPESGNIKDFTKEYYSLLSSNELIMKYLDTFAYHSYGSDDNLEEKADFGKWAKENIKTNRFDMSEWCELPCKHDTKSIDSALIMARIIGEDLIYTGVDSWTAWVCANQLDNAIKDDGKCYSDGLLTAKDDFSEYYISMRYYAVAHFSRFVLSGSESLDIGFNTARGFSLFAFKNNEGRYTLVAVNNSKAKRVIEPDVDFDTAEIITTTQAEQLKSETVKSKKITIEPKSISTVILK
ncbi:MAG: glycoside hydrolase [Eubacteriales bacterium]|nr:glycoside hydrolase [Eubacteriales bacterium]